MSVLTKYILTLKAPSGIEPHFSMGSAFHGILMEHVDADYAAYLHASQVHPFSQCLLTERGSKECLWIINTLSREAFREIILPLQEKTEFYMKHKEASWTVREQDVVHIELEELVERHMLSKSAPEAIRFSTVSPTGFRQDGQYQALPSSYLVVQTLWQKFNAFYQGGSLRDVVDLYALVASCQMQHFKLQSSLYSVGKGRVPAFTGWYTLNLRGPLAHRQMLGLLGAFAEFSGIGIKVALGMGGTTTELLLAKPTKRDHDNQ